jgi:A/G-specific adenine glycosylase
VPSEPDFPSDLKIEEVRGGILQWFAINRRDLPWRHTRDPYHILVSEVMLQQTQVDRVKPYYRAWLERFPTIADLAAAPTADVISLWAGLGYNRRAVNLQRTARYVVEELDGVFPTDVLSLLALPGVGPYTAGAIACFALEKDVAFLDTNMRRTLHRIFFGVDVPKPSASERDVLAVAERIVPPGNCWTWNQALIEFGALQCTARRPACVVCPVRDHCLAAPEIQSALALLPAGSRRKQEAPFTGSNRYYRGRVVDVLRELNGKTALADTPGIDLTSLGQQVRADFTSADLPWLYELVQGLANDGLAAVAEERAPYDPGTPADEPGEQTTTPNVRVKLP